ncbi:hypothetical protein GCM10011488_01680 [Steroidobacter agaridevorans]|nr:hypothetical protein GCM10011488_01680 [Steroidobacter agaridevorans]
MRGFFVWAIGRDYEKPGGSRVRQNGRTAWLRDRLRVSLQRDVCIDVSERSGNGRDVLARFEQVARPGMAEIVKADSTNFRPIQCWIEAPALIATVVSAVP